jgi:hypothetical protein
MHHDFNLFINACLDCHFIGSFPLPYAFDCIGQVHAGEWSCRGTDSGFRRQQQFTDKSGHVFDLFTDILDVCLLTVPGSLLQNADRHLNAHNGRRKLMGDITQETLLAIHITREAFGHIVDRPTQPAEFIPAAKEIEPPTYGLQR